MCTTFCKCPGSPTDEHYKQYEAIPDAKYAQYDRAFKYIDNGETDVNKIIER
jgi:hypothetical protein